VVIFDAGWQGERRPEARLRRDDLITTGQLILDMIHRQAIALNEEASQVIAKSNHIAGTNKVVPEGELTSNSCQSPASRAETEHDNPDMLQGLSSVVPPAGVISHVEPLNDWQQHPDIKSVIYQIDEADLLTPANTRLLAGYIKGLQTSGADSENTLSHAIQMAKQMLNPEEEQLQLAIDNGEAA